MTATTAATGPIYSTFGDDPDMGELVDLFVGEIPDRIAALEAQFAAGDLTRLGHTAHQLKGAAGSYGFPCVTPVAARVEAAAKSSGPADRIREALDELVAICGRMRAGSCR